MLKIPGGSNKSTEHALDFPSEEPAGSGRFAANGGRSHLNVTELDRPQRHIGDVAEQVRAGNMPPWFYLPMHPTARLTEIEKQALIEGAQKSLGPQGHQ